MAETRQKTISYHRAEYQIDVPDSISLAACIKDATDKRQTVTERTILRSNGQIVRIATHRIDQNKGHFLHLTADTPGEPASIVPIVDDAAKEVLVETTAPPEGSEFMDGDAFLYVRDNDICICATTISVAAIRQFFVKFFENAKIRKDAGMFDLLNATDTARLARIINSGVKTIEIKSSLYNASMTYRKRKSEPVGALDVVSRFFKAIFANEHDVTEDALRVAVTLTSDGRAKGLVVGQKRLNDLATIMLEKEEDDDDFVIVLNNKEKILPGEIFLRTKVDIAVKGKSVDRDKAWQKVLDYYNGLLGTGAIGQ